VQVTEFIEFYNYSTEIIGCAGLFNVALWFRVLCIIRLCF